VRVNKYEVELDNGAKMTFSSARSEAEAQRFAERSIERAADAPPNSHSAKWADRTVESVRLVKRGLFG
jgi:hypothetical protein